MDFQEDCIPYVLYAGFTGESGVQPSLNNFYFVAFVVYVLQNVFKHNNCLGTITVLSITADIYHKKKLN